MGGHELAAPADAAPPEVDLGVRTVDMAIGMFLPWDLLRELVVSVQLTRACLCVCVRVPTPFCMSRSGHRAYEACRPSNVVGSGRYSESAHATPDLWNY